MSDPPPRKVSSLRDRIAAFENKGGSAPTPGPPPAPRPKPGHIAWAPKPASPPASPRGSGTRDEAAEARKAAGMSAADAKESIGKLSLKERMAALQGSGAFGAPAPPAGPPPRPAGDKPKWKPPPVVQKAEPIGGDDDEDKREEKREEGEGKAAAAPEEGEKEREQQEGQEEKDDGEPDPQEEERQRRAALAARMAKLGGARIGMAPPIFGKKPDVPPKKVHKEEEEPKEEKPAEPSSAAEAPEAPTVVEPASEDASAPASTEQGEVTGSADYFAASSKDSATSATLSPESAAASPLVRSPAMPVPQVPKRAAPPRKRAAKSPSPAPPPAPVVDQELHESPSPVPPTAESTIEEVETSSAAETAELKPHGDSEPEPTAGQVEKSPQKTENPEQVKEDALADADAPETPAASEPVEESPAPQKPAEQEHIAEPPATEPEDHSEEVTEAHESEAPAEEEPKHAEHDTASEAPAEAHTEEPEEEEDEAARRKRIAERIAKSGGFNPFGGGLPPAPVRRDSADSTRSARSPIASPPAHPLIPVRRDSHDAAPTSPPQLPTSPKPHVPERKGSVGSVRSEVGIGSPVRKDSLDDQRGATLVESGVGVGDEAEARGRPLTRIAPVEEEQEDAPEETPQYEGVQTRGEHEAVHSPADERTGEDAEDAVAPDEYRHACERQDGPQHVEEQVLVSESPHHPSHAPRPIPPPPVEQAQEIAEDELAPPPAASPPPPPKRHSLPPPPRAVPLPPAPPAEEDVEEERVASPEPEDDEAFPRHAHEIGPEHEVDAPEEQPHDNDAHHTEYVDPIDAGSHEEYAKALESVSQSVPPPPPPHPHPPRHASIPVPPPPAQRFVEDEDEEYEDDDFGAPPLPPQPPRRTSANIPPPAAYAPFHEDKDYGFAEDEESAEEAETASSAPPPRQTRPASPPAPAAVSSRPILSPLKDVSSVAQEEEVLPESDVDPIDPEFYSPQRSATLDKSFPISPIQSLHSLTSPPPPPPRVVSPPAAGVPSLPLQQVVSPPPPPPARVASPPPPPQRVASPPAPATSPPPAAPEHEEINAEEEEEDPEQARRRTIAERMAKLGGIRFGAPPPMPGARRPPPPPEPEHEDGEAQGEAEKPAEVVEPVPEEEEEDEFARKQRIAARIAGMGGMRFGMLPGAAPPAPRPPVRHAEDEEEERAKSPPPPKRSAPAVPPPPPPQHGADAGDESDYHHVSDGEPGGHEESELEEVTHTDAEEDAPPPPVPDRGARRTSTGPPPVPHGRPLSPPVTSPPPVPRTRPPPPPTHTYPPPPPPPPLVPTTHEAQGDFVIVDQGQEGTEEPPPPPPPRAGRPPPRGVPLPPPPPGLVGEPSQAQWEQPAIPRVDFGGEADLSLSGQWSDESTNYPQRTPEPALDAPQQTDNAPAAQPPVEQHLTPDELMAHWGRVGVQIHEVAAALYEKSKKSVVGDGSYVGFVTAVLGQVPTAAQPAPPFESFGYLVYSQAAGAVQRRASDIMPGDVLVVHEAKFKGHKGLQSYHQNVGVGQPLIAVIGDFESKKSKVKVYQASQHVGQQSVESASYRLEDLKSGSVKVFRVLEA